MAVVRGEANRVLAPNGVCQPRRKGENSAQIRVPCDSSRYINLVVVVVVVAVVVVKSKRQCIIKCGDPER